MLRKITVDNGLKFIPQTEQSHERDIVPNTIENRKQNKKLSQ